MSPTQDAGMNNITLTKTNVFFGVLVENDQLLRSFRLDHVDGNRYRVQDQVFDVGVSTDEVVTLDSPEEVEEYIAEQAPGLSVSDTTLPRLEVLVTVPYRQHCKDCGEEFFFPKKAMIGETNLEATETCPHCGSDNLIEA